MNVQIKGKVRLFDNDFSHQNPKWKKKLEDFYSFQNIEGTVCFVKRSESQPAAWDLIEKLKGKELQFLPNVYDTSTTKEFGKTVYYYFTETLVGKTIAEAIKEKEEIDLLSVIDNVSDALVKLHKLGFWFGDLNEENIFKTNNSAYYLIDLDSCWAINIKPSPVMNSEGYVPNKTQDFTIPVIHYFKEYLQKNNYGFSSTRGDQLNYLQLIFLIVKLKYYYEKKSLDPSFSYIGKSFIDVEFHEILNSINPNFANGLFTTAYQNNVNVKSVISLGKIITQGKVNQPNFINVNVDKPIISTFHISQNTNSLTIDKGEKVTIHWEAQNAKNVYLLLNGIEEKVNPIGDKEVKVDEHTIVKLRAFNYLFWDKIEKEITIDVIIPQQTSVGFLKWAAVLIGILSIGIGGFFFYEDSQYHAKLHSGDIDIYQENYKSALANYQSATEHLVFNKDRQKESMVRLQSASENYFIEKKKPELEQKVIEAEDQKSVIEMLDNEFEKFKDTQYYTNYIKDEYSIFKSKIREYQNAYSNAEGRSSEMCQKE